METSETKRADTWIYVLIAGIIIVLMIAGALVRLQTKRTAEAEAKAKLFVLALKAEDMEPLTVDEAVALFGTDGGALAEFNGNPKSRALLGLQLAGNAGISQRPLSLTRRFLLAEETVLAVYRPEALPEFKAWADSQYSKLPE